jgi:hypothetical protein
VYLKSVAAPAGEFTGRLICAEPRDPEVLCNVSQSEVEPPESVAPLTPSGHTLPTTWDELQRLAVYVPPGAPEPAGTRTTATAASTPRSIKDRDFLPNAERRFTTSSSPPVAIKK